MKRVKIPIKGDVCTREGGLTTQSNGGEQQFARAVIITRAALPPLCLQSMAIALRGSGDIIIEWLPLACVLLCVCVELVVMTTEQEWHVEALASSCCCCCCGHWSLSRAQTFRPAIHRGHASYRRSLAAALCLFIRTLSPAGTGASLAQSPAAEVGMGRTRAGKQAQVG